MPLLFIWLFIAAMCVSQCTQAQAMTIVESQQTYTTRLEALPSARDEIKRYICSKLGCPTSIKVDELKASGHRLAAIHVSAHFTFN